MDRQLLVTGNKIPAVFKAKGFTLIELIVVIAIIAIIVTVAVISVGSPNFRKFLGGAEQIASIFAVLADESVYSGDVISCSITPISIRCQRYRQNEWSEIDMHRIVSGEWPAGIKILKVFVNGVSLKDNEQIKFLPSGDNQSLSIQVGNGEFSAWIDSDLTGRYKVAS